MRYEYNRLQFDFGDLQEMNQLSRVGWKVVLVERNIANHYTYFALMERPLPPA